MTDGFLYKNTRAKIKEYQKIVSNNIDIPIPKDFATKHVEHTQKGTVLSVW